MAADRTCPGCRAELETPLACGACGRLIEARGEPTPFELFGLDPSARVDAAALRRRLLRFSRLVHPDFFGTGSAHERALAERNTALLNEAYRVLSDDFARTDWIVRRLGGPAESEERELPKEFLLEVLEWNEALEEARLAGAGAPLSESLVALERKWRDERRTELDRALDLLSPPPPRGAPALVEARRILNAVRYLDRLLDELEALRLARAAG